MNDNWIVLTLSMMIYNELLLVKKIKKHLKVVFEMLNIKTCV